MSLRVKDIVSTMLQMRTISHAALQRTTFITLCPVDIKCFRTKETAGTPSARLAFLCWKLRPMFIVTFTAPLPSPVVSCHCHLLQQCTFLLLKHHFLSVPHSLDDHDLQEQSQKVQTSSLFPQRCCPLVDADVQERCCSLIQPGLSTPEHERQVSCETFI